MTNEEYKFLIDQLKNLRFQVSELTALVVQFLPRKSSYPKKQKQPYSIYLKKNRKLEIPTLKLYPSTEEILTEKNSK